MDLPDAPCERCCGDSRVVRRESAERGAALTLCRPVKTDIELLHVIIHEVYLVVGHQPTDSDGVNHCLPYKDYDKLPRTVS